MISFLKKHKNEFIVGIICSLIVSAIFYILSLQKVDMRYTLLTLPIANTWNDNNLQYNNTKINNLSLTIVTITNKGNKALNGNTMLKKTPLTVSLDKNFKILDIYNQDRKTSTSLDYSLVTDNNSIAIPFEVINPNDTLKFSVIHTGYSNDDFSVTGNWENGNGIKDDTFTIQTMKKVIVASITTILAALAGMLMSIFATIKDVNNKTKINYDKILEALKTKSEDG